VLNCVKQTNNIEGEFEKRVEVNGIKSQHHQGCESVEKKTFGSFESNAIFVNKSIAIILGRIKSNICIQIKCYVCVQIKCTI